MSLVYEYILPLATADGFDIEKRGDMALLSDGDATVAVAVSGLEHIQNSHKASWEMLVESRYANAKETLIKKRSGV